jgi:serine/threonine-protein kinase
MWQAASALQKAAEQGIVHRDIKPENIMLTDSDEVKVADFGLARLTDEGDALHLTQAGVTMGTPLYMSPEQVQGKPLDPRSDIYSFGVTCYHMLAGEPPFRADSALGVAVQHINTQPKPLDAARPDLPPTLCRIVHKSLAKDPAERYQSAAELLDDLRSVRGGGVADALPPHVGDREATHPTAAVTRRLEATRRLAAVMDQPPPDLLARHARKLFAALILLAALLGALLNLLSRERFLLETPQVPRQGTVELQLQYARRNPSPAAWQSVEDYFPQKRYQVLLARQGLAWTYLETGQDEAALDQFAKLAGLDDPGERAFRAVGLAGRFIVLSRQGRHAEAEALWELELQPLLDDLRRDERPDQQVQQLIQQAHQQNIEALSRP